MLLGCRYDEGLRRCVLTTADGTSCVLLCSCSYLSTENISLRRRKCAAFLRLLEQKAFPSEICDAKRLPFPRGDYKPLSLFLLSPFFFFLFILNSYSRLRHRGPDWSGYRVDEANHTVICHERLAIVGITWFCCGGDNFFFFLTVICIFSQDVEHGAQPLTNEHDTVWLSVNGEIYNRTFTLCIIYIYI